MATELIQLVTKAALLTAGFLLTNGNGDVNAMQDIEGPITAKAKKVRSKFRTLLDQTNKENPHPRDVKALSDLLSENKRLELWRDVRSVGYLAGADSYTERPRNISGEGMLEAQTANVEERPGQ